MSLPSFAPYPPVSARKTIPFEEWEICLEAWTTLAQKWLLMLPEIFAECARAESSFLTFLISYARNSAAESTSDVLLSPAKVLRRHCLSLSHRALTQLDPVPSSLLSWEFLSDLSILYGKSINFRSFIDDLWYRNKLDQNVTMQEAKRKLVQLLDTPASKSLGDLDLHLLRTCALLRSSVLYGQFLMTGSDVLDSLASAWRNSSLDLKKKLAVIAYSSLLSLSEGEKPKTALLIDHLYSLKATSDTQTSGSASTSLLSNLTSTSTFLRKIQDRTTGADADRARSLLADLRRLKLNHSIIPIRRKVNKGKVKERPFSHTVADPASISVLQELFPHLGTSFLTALLQAYGNNSDLITAHLLDDALPPHLSSLDRSSNLPSSSHPSYHADLVPHLAPATTPPSPPERHNIFANDDFDNLAISPSQLHHGRKDVPLNESDVLEDPTSRPSKSAIYAALAAFDSDDDERDDTYDVEDVGGTVDTSLALPGGETNNDEVLTGDGPGDRNEEVLFKAWKSQPQVFGRDAATRRGAKRAALKKETGMSDEAIEGWAVMLGRESDRLRRLERRFADEVGGQRALAGTAWRGLDGESEDGEENAGGGRGRGRGRGGFRGRERGRGRGNVAGPSGERETQVARQRKDANKSSRANHNRRDQRARKVARSGFPG